EVDRGERSPVHADRAARGGGRAQAGRATRERRRVLQDLPRGLHRRRTVSAPGAGWSRGGPVDGDHFGEGEEVGSEGGRCTRKACWLSVQVILFPMTVHLSPHGQQLLEAALARGVGRSPEEVVERALEAASGSVAALT